MTSSYDTSTTSVPDGPFKEWPGAGPVPEPEEEGFRAKLIEAEKARREQAQADYEERCNAASDFYSGATEADDAKAKSSTKKSGSSSSSSTKATSSS